MLYSSDYDNAAEIYAYSLWDYTLQEAYCIKLLGADVDKVGGGVFDSNGHLFMTSDEYQDIRAFNALTGQYQGTQSIDVSSGEEVEGITIWPTQSGPNVEIHVVLWKGPGLSWPWQWGDAIRKIYAVPNPNDITPHT
jgi:hypothetical protein